jgi:hypothetical protein
MRQLDLKNRNFYDSLDADERKKFSTFLMIRWSSAVEGSRELQEYYVQSANHYVNKHFFTLSRHPKLQWLTLVACSHESKAKQFHEWIALKKEKNKKEEFLATIFPTMKRADIATLAVITTDKEIKDYCQNLGWDKKEVNAIKF